MGAVSYMGVPLLDVDGRVIGHLAVLDTPAAAGRAALIAASSASSPRARRPSCAGCARKPRVREREEKLARLVDGAMDAIVELDDELA